MFTWSAVKPIIASGGNDSGKGQFPITVLLSELIIYLLHYGMCLVVDGLRQVAEIATYGEKGELENLCRIKSMMNLIENIAMSVPGEGSSGMLRRSKLTTRPPGLRRPTTASTDPSNVCTIML